MKKAVGLFNGVASLSLLAMFVVGCTGQSEPGTESEITQASQPTPATTDGHVPDQSRPTDALKPEKDPVELGGNAEAPIAEHPGSPTASLPSVDTPKSATTGNGPDATPIEVASPAVAMTQPAFLTPERRKLNLLADATFEDEFAGRWKIVSWRNSNLAGAIEDGVAKEGQKAAAIHTTVTDDIHFDQTVPVKPQTRYLLSGWIKTKDVVIEAGQQYGKSGASLSIWGGYEHSRSIVGTTDWTYVTLIFDSRDRTEVTVCARLGYWHSVAQGEAWFDDLSLIPIGKSPASLFPLQAANPNAPVLKVGQELVTFKGHARLVSSVTFSSDGKRVASAGDGTVRIWDAATGEEILAIDEFATYLAHSPDGQQLATAAFGVPEVKLLDAISGKELRTLKGDRGSAYSLAYSSDGKRLAAGGGFGKVTVWDTGNGQKTLTFQAHPQLTRGVAFSADGKRLATAGGSDMTVKLWDAASGTVLLTLPGEDVELHGVAYSPDEKWVAASSYYGRVKVWDAKTGQIKLNFNGHNGSVISVVFDPNSKWLASGAADGTARIWDATSGRHLLTLQHGDSVTSVAVSPDGKRLATAGRDQTVKVWDIATLLAASGDRAASPGGQEWNGWPADGPLPAIAPFNSEQAAQHQQTWAKQSGVPVEYINSIGMKFRLIPPGEFTLGASAAEIEAALQDVGDIAHWRNCIRSEGLQHKVILTRPYYLGAHEVTRGQFARIAGKDPSFFRPADSGKGAPGDTDTSTLPVENVNWHEITDFCNKLSELEKLAPSMLEMRDEKPLVPATGYRLPTEAEWQFACRAGTTTKYWNGDSAEDLAKVGWFQGNSNGSIHPVGQLMANPFGLFDTHGNVWERVLDRWEPTLDPQFLSRPAINPSQPSFGRFPCADLGGSFDFIACFSRASMRTPLDANARFGNNGFRVMLTVDAVQKALASPVQSDAAQETKDGK